MNIVDSIKATGGMMVLAALVDNPVVLPAVGLVAAGAAIYFGGRFVIDTLEPRYQRARLAALAARAALADGNLMSDIATAAVNKAARVIPIGDKPPADKPHNVVDFAATL